jgi:hypothetical protein
VSIHVALNHVMHYRYDRLVTLGPQIILWSAKTLSRAGQREGILVMKPAKDWYG